MKAAYVLAACLIGATGCDRAPDGPASEAADEAAQSAQGATQAVQRAVNEHERARAAYEKQTAHRLK